MKDNNLEKKYTVQQIAELLNTNPETVRRWIRDKKLGAVQVSRKDGNIITETEFQKFLKTSPKYMTKLATDATRISPWLGVATIAGTVAAGIYANNNTKKNTDVRVLATDLKKYISESVDRLQESITKKEVLIKQTEEEIDSLQKQIEQYRLILSNEDILNETVKTITENSLVRED